MSIKEKQIGLKSHCPAQPRLLFLPYYLCLGWQLEHVALVQFSSLFSVTVPFTRDIDLVRSKLSSIQCQVL